MKDFLESFNTIALIIYLTGMLVFISSAENPIVQAVFFFSVCILIIISDKKAIKNALILSAFIGIPIILINPIVNSRGATVLLRLSEIVILGDIKITLEALVFSLSMALKLVNTVLMFVFFNICAQPDRIFNLIAVAAPRSAITASLTAKMVPDMIESSKRISEIQMTRGVEFNSKNLLKRISNGWPFIKILLLSSLEDSWQTAEALESKGYGLSKRKVYNREKIGYKDFMIILGGFIGVSFLLINDSKNFINFKFFPTFNLANNYEVKEYLMLAVIFAIVVLPVLLGLGGCKCNFIKQKI